MKIACTEDYAETVTLERCLVCGTPTVVRVTTTTNEAVFPVGSTQVIACRCPTSSPGCSLGGRYHVSVGSWGPPPLPDDVPPP